MKYDYLIVGAGLYGAVFAYLARKNGKKCLVIDKRNHIGGNVYCESIEGINVHKYGAHIFHTSDKDIWDFVNSIVPFNHYINSPIALAPNGKLYNLPFNMNTFHQMWGVISPNQAKEIIDGQKKDIQNTLHLSGVVEARNLEEQALSLIGKDIYEQLIKGYTEKQWGRPCCDLPSFIIKRLPVRFTYDNNYFNDLYQGIPIGGYNKLISGLLDGIDVKVSIDFFKDRVFLSGLADKIVFTGMIDEYFDYKYGKLEYRTVQFDTEVVDQPNFQGNAVVNFTSSSIPYTRIIEHKHFETFGSHVYDKNKTVISREYPMEWIPGLEPYYPVNDDRNNSIFRKYKDLAEKEENVIFGGRLAEYKYYDMAPTVKQAIVAYEKQKGE